MNLWTILVQKELNYLYLWDMCFVQIFFFCKFSLFFNKFCICSYRNNVPIFIFKLKYESLSLRIR